MASSVQSTMGNNKTTQQPTLDHVSHKSNN